MNFLEQLASEWYSYKGYFVRTNIKFGKRAKGGYIGEIDVAAFNPKNKRLIHIETSTDSYTWNERKKRFQKKFEKAFNYYSEIFDFSFQKVDLNPFDEFYFQWHITERCNKHCRHCYQNGHPSNDLPLTDLYTILDRMDEALTKWDRKGSLSLTGGEPYTRASDLQSLMDRIDQMENFAYYDILTNGSLLTLSVSKEPFVRIS